MKPIPVYVSQRSPRLSYLMDWLFRRQLKLDFQLIDINTATRIPEHGLGYGIEDPMLITIPDSGILWETKTDPLRILEGTWENLPVLFYQEPQNYNSLPFDIFGAIFYLISRYEEYLPYTSDKHGRFPATESILHKTRMLDRPIVDEWIAAFRALIERNWEVQLPRPVFRYQPTYDIDMAWSYQNKGLMRNFGGMMNDIKAKKYNRIGERLLSLIGIKKDPYDAFSKMQKWHQATKKTPIYFILCAQKNSELDKNIPMTEPAMKKLVKQLSTEGKIGIHPSSASGGNGVLMKEIQSLTKVTKKPLDSSRQHYLRFTLPDTYRTLASSGIKQEHSMGYSTHPGFRAGTSEPFTWYDLRADKPSGLEVIPFCFMDTAARFEQNQSAGDAFRTLNELADKLKRTGGQLVSVFHNFSLGTDADWSGWDKSYADWLEKV